MSPTPGKTTRQPVTLQHIDHRQGILTVATAQGVKFRIRMPREDRHWHGLRLGSTLELEIQGTNYILHYKPPAQSRPSANAPAAPSTAPVARPQPTGRPVVSPAPRTPPTPGTPPYTTGGGTGETAGEDEQIEARRIGIDPAYFHAREKERHRYEIMAFLKGHLDDDLVEWYQMRPEKPGRFASPERPLDPSVRRAIQAQYSHWQDFYTHQSQALELIRSGRHVIVVTQTASGKTLCYNPAIFEHFSTVDSTACALYLFPLNALMMDQKEKIDQLARTLAQQGIHVQAELLKGGLGREARLAIARDCPNILATNPEMLGVILDEARLWGSFFNRLRYIVIDEVHSYRGILGMHMAGFLRRLLLTARRQGAEPQFILSSATVSNPLDLAARLTSLPESAFTLLGEQEDGSQQACKHWVVLNPDSHVDVGGNEAYLSTAALSLIELITSQDARRRPAPLNTIVFARSIREVNKIHKIALENLRSHRPDLVQKVRKYVSAELTYAQKREIYDGLRSGEIVGVVSTNALEAGIDIGSLDACIIAGFPFWVMRMRQMAGRVGRFQEGLVAYVPHPVNPVDEYYRSHPELLLTQSPEVFVVDAHNPYIVRKHLNAAAYGLDGIRSQELPIFGPGAEAIARQAVSDQVMAPARDGYRGSRRSYLNRDDPYAITNIRSQAQRPYTLCREDGGDCNPTAACLDPNNKNGCERQVTILDQQYAYRDCHPGAVYESMDGSLFRITGFLDPSRIIYAQQIPDNTRERTYVEQDISIDILGEPWQRRRLPGGAEICLGEVRVTRLFSGYYTHDLVPRRRCRRCKRTYDDDGSAAICPMCSKRTIRFYDSTNSHRHEFPPPYQDQGLHISFKTNACWLIAPSEMEDPLYPASPCKLPGPENRVQDFLKRPFSAGQAASRLRLTPEESSVLEAYHRQASRPFDRGRRQREEVWLYPGTYGQCLLSALRQKLPESRALEIFEALTGYPVTADLKHVCRRCQTSALFPGLHTLEHTLTLRYPSVALGDPTDIAAHTTLGHSGTGAPTIFWYDNYEGGLGAADKIYERFEGLLAAGDKTLAGCSCSSLEGCPHCTQLSSCDQRNEAISKPAAYLVLGLLQSEARQIPFAPYVYPVSSRRRFTDQAKAQEHVKSAHGVGSEAPGAGAGQAVDPYQVLRLQRHVHQPVLHKAFEVRSVEITGETPPVSAVELNRAYQQLCASPCPAEWRITPAMSPYEVLEVLPSATPRMVSQVYRVIARQVHPDVFMGSKEQATEMMKLVNHAYDQLSRQKE
jgi:DEAD/DEAH box helicase domain-containing protein